TSVAIRVAQLVERRETHVRHRTQPPAAIAQLLDVDVRPRGLAKEIVGERDERSVTTAVVEQRAARRDRRKLARERKPASMAPRHDRVLAEELFPGVVSLLEQMRGRGSHR